MWFESAMRTPIASEVGAVVKLIKEVSQELVEKRCGDCREQKLRSQGYWSQNRRATLKTGIKVFMLGENDELGI
jgi:hypothetical protein